MPNDDLGLFCSQRTRASCSHWANHELIGMPKDCRIKYGKAWPQLGKKKQDSDPKHRSMTKKQNQGVAMTQWKSNPDWKAVVEP